MLNVFTNARCSLEFRTLMPTAIRVLEKYVLQIRACNVFLQDVIIRKSMSKAPSEYLNLVPQAVPALHLIRNGENVRAGAKYQLCLDKTSKCRVRDPSLAC